MPSTTTTTTIRRLPPAMVEVVACTNRQQDNCGCLLRLMLTLGCCRCRCCSATGLPTPRVHACRYCEPLSDDADAAASSAAPAGILQSSYLSPSLSSSLSHQKGHLKCNYLVKIASVLLITEQYTITTLLMILPVLGVNEFYRCHFIEVLSMRSMSW